VNSTKYQVFISSTYSDLEGERDSIIKAILEMYHIPIGMEMFSAEDEDQWEIIRRTIEVSDYYILVLGLRYGSKTSEGISFTQKEYEYALKKKIPVLAFVMDEMVSLSKDKRDNDLTEINAFRELVLKNSKMAQFWSSKEELIKNVSISLMKQIMQKPGIGWVRGDKLGAEEALSKELTSISKENRQLREKISDLELLVTPKTPAIEVSIDSPLIDDKFDEFVKLEIPGKINESDIEAHLQEFITSDDIEKFNGGLPNQLEVDQYNSELERQYKIENYSSPLEIHVSNGGTTKANNLFVDITFPEGILVYEKGQEFEKPNNPLPLNPIQIAQSKYKERQEEALRKLNPLSSLQDVMGMSRFSDLAIMSRPEIHMHNIQPLNQTWWTKLDSNRVTIKLDSLLHTRRRVFSDEYMIVPLSTGRHQIEVEIICEEYQRIDAEQIEMVV
jgi:hypothetical protein